MKTLLIALFLVAVTSLAMAQPRGMGRQEMVPDEKPGARMIERLKLTNDQQTQFDKLTSSLLKKQIALRSKIETARVELHDLMREEAPDQQKIITKQREINTLQGDIKSNRTGFWFDVNTILTPEQRKEWKQSPLMSMQERSGMKHRMMMRGNMSSHRYLMREMHEE
jgi:Spy/CpxP family protein refolding chaperone